MSNWRFGFELEGFNEVNGKPTLPLRTHTTDSFPGLVEVRTTGGQALPAALGELAARVADYPEVNFTLHEHSFSAQDKILLRSRHSERKDPATYTNLYGKQARNLGNKTLASFQINLSLLGAKGYTNSTGVTYPDRYHLFDFVPIVRELDKVFEKSLTASSRTKGWYSIKDGVRLEYRSLPNTVWQNYGFVGLYTALNNILKDRG